MLHTKTMDLIPKRMVMKKKENEGKMKYTKQHGARELLFKQKWALRQTICNFACTTIYARGVVWVFCGSIDSANSEISTLTCTYYFHKRKSLNKWNAANKSGEKLPTPWYTRIHTYIDIYKQINSDGTTRDRSAFKANQSSA